MRLEPAADTTRIVPVNFLDLGRESESSESMFGGLPPTLENAGLKRP